MSTNRISYTADDFRRYLAAENDLPLVELVADIESYVNGPIRTDVAWLDAFYDFRRAYPRRVRDALTY